MLWGFCDPEALPNAPAQRRVARRTVRCNRLACRWYLGAHGVSREIARHNLLGVAQPEGRAVALTVPREVDPKIGHHR